MKTLPFARAIGLGGLLLVASRGFAQSSVAQSSAAEAYKALETDSIWVHPSAESRVDKDAVRAAARRLEPTTLKVIVVPQLGTKWQRGGREMRGSFAKNLLENQFKLKNGVVIVYTKKGISVYSDRLGDARLRELDNGAARLATANDFTPAIVWLADNVDKKADATDTTRGISTAALVGIPVGIGVLAYAGYRGKKALELSTARENARRFRNAAIDGISYLDSYDGLITDQAIASAITAQRARAYAEYEKGIPLFDNAKTPEEYKRSEQLFRQALIEVDAGKQQVALGTGGTNTAYALHAPGAPIDNNRAPLFDPVEGVCYFTSKPCEVRYPVEANVNGQRRTVMVCEEVYQSMQRGTPPVMAGQNQNGQFTPWYDVRGYNPHQHYGSGSFLFDMLAFNALFNMGGWGNWGHHHHHDSGGWGGGSDWGSGSMDGGFGGGDIDMGGDFGSSGDWGGSDFGGGDFGGGDF